MSHVEEVDVGTKAGQGMRFFLDGNLTDDEFEAVRVAIRGTLVESARSQFDQSVEALILEKQKKDESFTNQ